MSQTSHAAELMEAWDAGSSLHPLARNGPLVHVVTGLDPGEFAELGIGEHDRLLVEVRERLFGSTMRAVEECPSCGVVLELEVATATLRAADRGPEAVSVDVAGYHVTCRVPRTTDLVDAAATGAATAARAVLVSRAVRTAHRRGRAVEPDAIPDDVVAAVAAALGEAEPLAHVELPIRCDGCGATWNRALHIDSFLWGEVEAWALRLLSEVHALAMAYGWTEGEVLALTPRRRRRYLELVGHG